MTISNNKGRSASSGPETILAIDDDPDVLVYLEFLLRKAGYLVVTASKPGEGEMLALRILPDLIILDLSMPTVSGQDILHELKNSSATQAIPVIIHSAESSMSSYIQCADEGASAFVGKPLNEEELLQKIRQCLSDKT